MALIPDEFVEELRKSVDIVDVISEYVQLRRAGRSFVGLCPFHNERSPSFSVSPDRQLYHCFGCGAGGTVIRFVMEVDGFSFTEAVVKLAERAGLTLPFSPESSPQSSSQSDRLQRMMDAHELAAKYYNYILMNTAVGVQALTYLETRGISRQTMVDYSLGVSPDGEDVLVKFLNKRGYENTLLVDAGLGMDMGRKVIDRFRNRMMIPIQDHQGHVVSFGGRTLQKDGKPKYLNSPETPLFHKSALLFNLHIARKEIRKTRSAVLFEGYMDVISASQAGVHNAVATMGTSITEDHAKTLRRYADRLTIAYDGDAAGVKAAKRALQIADALGFEVRVVEFPNGLDPDEFIRTYGSNAFQRQVSHHALSQVQFLLGDVRKNALLDSEAGRTDFLRKTLAVLGQKATPIERDAELRKLSEEFHVAVDALKEELSLVSKQDNKRRKAERTKVPRTNATAALPLQKGDVMAGNKLLQAMMTDAALSAWLLEHDVDELVLPEQTALLAHLYQFRSEHPDGSAVTFVDSLDDPTLASLATSLLMEDAPQFDPEVMTDYLNTIRLHRCEEDLREAMEHMLQSQVDGREQDMEIHKARVDELRQTIQSLKSRHRK